MVEKIMWYGSHHKRAPSLCSLYTAAAVKNSAFRKSLLIKRCILYHFKRDWKRGGIVECSTVPFGSLLKFQSLIKNYHTSEQRQLPKKIWCSLVMPKKLRVIERLEVKLCYRIRINQNLHLDDFNVLCFEKRSQVRPPDYYSYCT